jgi:hypothetical protein
MACRHLCVFAKDMGLRELTDDEVVAAAGDKRVLRAMKALGDLERSKDADEANADAIENPAMNWPNDRGSDGEPRLSRRKLLAITAGKGPV